MIVRLLSGLHLSCFADCVLTFPSLQQEAHKMVNEANVKQATAEKQVKEAQGKVGDANPYAASNGGWTATCSVTVPFVFPHLNTRSMFCKQRWRPSKPLCWPPRHLHPTASCIHSCSLQEPGERTNMLEDTSATTHGGSPHPHLGNQSRLQSLFTLWSRRTER